jgi:NtrC-family two-component system sensor histidine kinase KinB
VVALVAQAITPIKSTCEERSIALGVDLTGSAALTIRGDVERLGVVLANVLGNAVKYTPSDAAIDLVVEGDGDHVRLAVTDGGPGVPEEFRQRIFDKFFRVEHYRPHSEEGARGSGIGLYIAREIVLAHGGSIECQAGAGGRGACFVMMLPVAGGRPEGSTYSAAQLPAG